MTVDEKISSENIDELINRHMAFIIKKTSDFLGRYVSVENDDEFSIAISAFAEAVERYDDTKGKFLSFAGLVIESRLKTYESKKNRNCGDVSIEEMSEKGGDIAAEENNNLSLKLEIEEYGKELALFGLSFDKLADEAPKHEDTRKKAFWIAEKSSESSQITEKTYKKKKLPIRDVSKYCEVSEKTVKVSKNFILSALIIRIKKFPELLDWIENVRCFHV